MTKENNNENFDWNQEYKNENKSKQRAWKDSAFKKESKDKIKTFLDLLEDKLLSFGTTALKNGIKNVAVNKLQETEDKVMKNIDSKIATYKNKAIFGVLVFVGAVLVAYSFFEIFFKIMKHPEWTNFGAGMFFIFVAMMVYIFDSFKNKK